MGFLKFIVGMAIAVLLAIYLPDSLNVWLRLGITFMGCYLVVMGSDLFYGEGILGIIFGFIALVLFSGLMVGFWWFYQSFFDPWINEVTDNYNMGTYVLYALVVFAFVAGLTMMIVATIVMYKKNKRYQKDKSEAERLADEDELIQQKLAAVKGNWLKKEMIAQKLKRQYVEQKMIGQKAAHKRALSKWDSVYDWSHAAFVFGAVPIGFVLLFCLLFWLTM